MAAKAAAGPPADTVDLLAWDLGAVVLEQSFDRSPVLLRGEVEEGRLFAHGASRQRLQRAPVEGRRRTRDRR